MTRRRAAGHRPRGPHRTYNLSREGISLWNTF